MSLRFKSSTPETWKIVSVGPDGRERVAVATRNSGDFNWKMQLTHPSGRNWQASYHGEHIIDALGELVTSKNTEFLQERGRGYRSEQKPFDRSRQVSETGEFAPPITGDITMITRR